MRGQGTVEMAVVMPMFFLLMMGAFDFGRAVWYANAISNAAREGARHAIIRTHDDASIRKQVKDFAVGVPLVDGDITISPSGSRTAKANVTVSIKYQFVPITPLISNAIGGPFDLDASSTMRAEY
ncbi:MAG: pilus assembly protein [Chloroflexota bacterium]|nr:pilus assembly protein [Chloroflexota bacterium]